MKKYEDKVKEIIPEFVHNGFTVELLTEKLSKRLDFTRNGLRDKMADIFDDEIMDDTYEGNDYWNDNVSDRYEDLREKYGKYLYNQTELPPVKDMVEFNNAKKEIHKYVVVMRRKGRMLDEIIEKVNKTANEDYFATFIDLIDNLIMENLEKEFKEEYRKCY